MESELKEDDEWYEAMFQSPCGDSINGKIKTKAPAFVEFFLFQSPCGDFINGKIVLTPQNLL